MTAEEYSKEKEKEAGCLYVPVFIGLRDKKPGDKVRFAIIKED